MTNVETIKPDTSNDEQAGSDDNDDTPDPVVTIDVEKLAATPLADLTVTTFSDSRIGSLDRAASYWASFEEAATDWFESRRKNRSATRRAAIAQAMLAELVVDEKGNPMWSAQSSVTAWRVLYQDRVKPLLVKLATDAGDPKAATDFDAAVRRYIADRHLKRVVVADYCRRTTNGLGDKPYTTGRGAPATTIKAALADLLADTTPDNLGDLENYKWNAELTKLVKPHVERQVVKTGTNKGNRQRGFEGSWTSINPPADTGGSGGDDNPDPAKSAGMATYKSAKDKLTAWPNSEHWNPLAAVDFLHEILTADSVKFEAGKRVKGKADVIARLHEIGRHAATLADMMSEQGKSDKPTPADVQKLHYVDEN